MFVRYGKAALLAAILALTGNALWAQQACPCKKKAGTNEHPYEILSCPTEIKGFACFSNHSCAVNGCCKDGKCCKDGECCSISKKCDAKCSCAKDDKCACCKDGECGCGKSGKCSCSQTQIGCCPLMNQAAKHTAIIMVMPASMPLPVGCCMDVMGQMAHPAMLPPMPPMPPHVMLPPPPMPPPVPLPHMIQVSGRNFDIPSPCYSDTCVGYRVGTPAQTGAPLVCCTISKAPTTPKLHITAQPSNSELEINVAEGTCIHCKKMTVSIGDHEIAVSRYNDTVRIRGEELYATAACVCSDGKDCLILEGNAVLHYKKDGRSAKVIAEHIVMNLSNGAMTTQSTGRISQYAAPYSPSNLTPVRVHGGIEP